MAGEWIAYDLALPAKPEVQELIDETGQPVEVVVYRLLQLWGWASMHCSDGTARMTLPRLVRTCGGDEAFWLAVASVGWLEIDETAATVAVPGWDRRFSQAAKSRAQHQDRAKAQNDREPERRRRAAVACAQAQAVPAPTRSRGEESGIPPPPREASPSEAGSNGWEALRAAWGSGPGAAWKPAAPPEPLADRLAEPGWLAEALEAIPRLRACRYFDTPVTLVQFCGHGFVQRVLGGQYDAPKTPKKPAGGPDAPAPPRIDPAFEAAKAATLAREAARRAAEHARLDAQAAGAAP
jgi:hypothetical protein